VYPGLRSKENSKNLLSEEESFPLNTTSSFLFHPLKIFRFLTQSADLKVKSLKSLITLFSSLFEIPSFGQSRIPVYKGPILGVKQTKLY